MQARSTMLLIFLAATTTGAAAQQQSAPALTRDEIAALARAEIAVARVRDSMNVLLAQPRNKKDEQQKELRDNLRKLVSQVLQKNGLTDADYRNKTYVISADLAARKAYDSVVVGLTGTPIPGQGPATPAGVPVPAGAVGTHVGHVVNTFGDTPSRQGLLPTAMGEARIAAQHAQLASRQPANLDYMKTHAAHVINAVDPAVLASGPGLGYGVKKAALGVAMHIDLAAAQQGASPNVILHAKHIATAARNTVERADQVLALAQRVQGSTNAAEAAALVSQMASLADQLMAGADLNADGRVTPDVGEGGLVTADEHLKLLLAIER